MVSLDFQFPCSDLAATQLNSAQHSAFASLSFVSLKHLRQGQLISSSFFSLFF